MELLNKRISFMEGEKKRKREKSNRNNNKARSFQEFQRFPTCSCFTVALKGHYNVHYVNSVRKIYSE